MDGSGTLLSRSRKAKFFEGLGTRELREIVGAAEIRSITARKIILMAGETATHLYLLVSGHTQFYRLSRQGDKVLLSRLANGDIFGLGTLLSRRMFYIGTAETTRESEFLVWEQARIRKLAQRYPKFGGERFGNYPAIPERTCGSPGGIADTQRRGAACSGSVSFEQACGQDSSHRSGNRSN